MQYAALLSCTTEEILWVGTHGVSLEQTCHPSLYSWIVCGIITEGIWSAVSFKNPKSGCNFVKRVLLQKVCSTNFTIALLVTDGTPHSSSKMAR